MRVVPVPTLQDNYAYLVICERTGKAAVVDPGEAPPVLAAAQREGVTLDAVWATHHHGDHVGGVPALVDAIPGLRVVASTVDKTKVPKVTDVVDDGDETAVGDVRARIIHNPGHTLGAISFWIEDGAAVFTGDTLFGAGCGRLFEGTPAQMHTSLSRLVSLPPETKVYFGHEYTEANLRFAAAVEPDSAEIAARTAVVTKCRASHAPTTPSTVADERATNPFARPAEPAVRAAAKQSEPSIDDSDPAAVLGAIRRWKDRFR